MRAPRVAIFAAVQLFGFALVGCSAGGSAGDGGSLAAICAALFACPYLTPDGSFNDCAAALASGCAGDQTGDAGAGLAASVACLHSLSSCEESAASEQDYANAITNCQPSENGSISGLCQAAVSAELHALQGRVKF